MPVLVALPFLFLAVLCATTPCRVVAPCHTRLCARVCLLCLSVSRSGVSAHSQSGGLALRGLSLVWGVRAETSGSIAPTWGVSLGGGGGLLFDFHVHCEHYLAVLAPVWCSHDLHSTRRDFVLKHILHRRHVRCDTYTLL